MTENDEDAQPPPPVIVDDAGRLLILDPETTAQSRLVAQSCAMFQSKLEEFHIYVKQLLDEASEKAEQIEDAKTFAIGMQHAVAAEMETRPEKFREQAGSIACKQAHLERLNVEYDSLMTVKREQDILIARLSHSSLQV